MSRIRVLQIIPSFATGGAERFLAQLMCAFDKKRFELTALSLYGSQNTQPEAILERGGIPVRFLGKKPGFDIRMFTAIRREMRRFRPDLVHTHLHALNYFLPSMLRVGALPVVHTVHSIAERERKRIGRLLPSILFGRAIQPVAVGVEVQNSIRRVFGVESHLIPNGIPVERFRRDEFRGLAFREELGFGPESLLCVSVGRFESVKNHALLMRAFGMVSPQVPNLQLLLAGDGELRHQLEALAVQLGIRELVHFIGIRSDIASLLHACDFYAFASDSEGSPLSVMEAMAAGLPIAGTAVGGVPEMVPESTGILVRPRNTEALAQAILRLANESECRIEMSRRAAEHASLFDIGLAASTYASLYDRLLQRDVRGASAKSSIAESCKRAEKRYEQVL